MMQQIVPLEAGRHYCSPVLERDLMAAPSIKFLFVKEKRILCVL